MTKLTSKVRRESWAMHRAGGKTRAILVELRPPDLIVFRLKGTRREYPLSIPGAFDRAVKIEALAEMKERKARRLERKKARGLS